MTYKKSLYGLLYRFVILTTATLTLAACGGGGGNSVDNSTPLPPAPATVADAAFTVAATAVTIPVLANDTPVAPGDINAASVVTSQSLNGTAVANANGTVTFTPAAGFTGTATFAYQVANTAGAMSLAATVTVNVTGDPGVQTWFFPDRAALTADFTNSLGLIGSPTEFSSFDTQGLYFNVHSAANPAGEIRGQIVPTSTVLTDNGNPATGNVFSALLSGTQEVPTNVSKASAYGSVVLDPVAKTIRGVIVTSGINGTLAHIHQAQPGVIGPIIFPFTGGPAVWTLAATAITDAQILDLQNGAYYLNVHSTDLPVGEIRGQLTQQARFAALSGANQNPIVITTASGTGVLALNPTTRQVSGFIQTTGIVGGILAHVHEAAAGANGGVIIPSNGSSFVETPVGSGLWVVPADPALSTLTPAQVVSFNAGNLYFNVHTLVNPGGEIRDQLQPATVKIGNASLDGTKETPPLTTAASATGIMALNSVTKLVNGNVKTTAITGILSHVHEGAAGVAGPIIIPLSLTPPASTIPVPLAVSTTTLPAGVVGTAYSQSVTAVGGTAPYTWLVTVGTLPAGLNISAAGLISGTPTTVSNPSFTVTVTDSVAVTATMQLSINVTAAAPAGISISTIQPIFNASCVGCHTVNLTGFPNLTTNNSFASLTQGASPAVIPGNSAGSRLFVRISGASALGPQMPLAGIPLTAANQLLIKNWIDAGALP